MSRIVRLKIFHTDFDRFARMATNAPGGDFRQTPLAVRPASFRHLDGRCADKPERSRTLACSKPRCLPSRADAECPVRLRAKRDFPAADGLFKDECAGAVDRQPSLRDEGAPTASRSVPAGKVMQGRETRHRAQVPARLPNAEQSPDRPFKDDEPRHLPRDMIPA
jgi:hypothetical protein